VRFEVFAALKILVVTVVWVMTSCSFIGGTDGSEEPIASIFEVE
jgi:hypothetical protein